MHTLRLRVLCLVRYLRPDHNPLRRPVDRVHSRVVIALLALFLVTGPLAIALTVAYVGGAGVRAEHRQAQTRHRVDAVVLSTSGPVSRLGHYETAQIRWRDVRGTAHTGVITPRKNDHVGTHRKVWIDQAGDLTTRPRTHTQTIADTTMAALAALSAITLLHGGAYAFTNRRLDRRRLALWENEWTAVAPRWTGRP